MPFVINEQSHSKFRLKVDSIAQEASKIVAREFSSEIKSLNTLHLNNNNREDVNTLRVKAYQAINKELDWKQMIFDATFEDLTGLMGQDIAIQKNINLSIQMPWDNSSVLPAHKDTRSGDSPFQKVIWIPLTKCWGSNSMFIEGEMPAGRTFIDADTGEYIIFDPNQLHGNTINETNSTRVSLNVRVKNWFAPDLGEVCGDRAFGVYYEDFMFSSSTINGLKIWEEIVK